MAVTYYVALPFIRIEDGTAPGEAQDARTPRLAGTLQFRAPARRLIFGILARPCLVLKKFGDVARRFERAVTRSCCCAAMLGTVDLL